MIKPYSEKWERYADMLARDYAPDIYPCAKCNHPVIKGYCCTFCGDSDPSTPREKDEQQTE